MVKALAINGSHRKGKNTATLLQQVLDELTLFGVDTELVSLPDYNLKWCTSCNHCMRATECSIQDDDMGILSKKMLDADIIIMGSPTYWANVSAMMKNFMDRTRYMHLAKHLLDGKIGAAVTQAGMRNGGQEACIASMESFMKAQGLIIADLRDPEQPVAFGSVTGSLQKGYDEKGTVWFKNVSEDMLAIEACKHLARNIVRRMRDMGKMV